GKWSRPVSFHPTSVSSRRKFSSSRRKFSSSHQRQLSFLAEQPRRAASLGSLPSRRCVPFALRPPSSCPRVASLSCRRVACSRYFSPCSRFDSVLFRPPALSHRARADSAGLLCAHELVDRPDCQEEAVAGLSMRN